MDPESENVYFMPGYLNATGENKSVILYGNTKPFKEEIKKLGFRFNSYLSVGGEKVPGWFYPRSKIKNMDNFINSFPFEVSLIDEDSNTEEVPNKNSKETKKPTSKTQKVTYIIEKPAVGDKVTIEFSDNESVGYVSDVTSNGNFIDKISIDIENSTYIGLIVSGSWQIIDFCNDHEIFFNK